MNIESERNGENSERRKPVKSRRRLNFLKGRRELPVCVYSIVGFFAWLLRLTLRLRVVDPEGTLSKKEPLPSIIVVWHNRLLFAPLLTPRRRRRRIAILASDSRDGEYAARYMRFFGFVPVRGSSSKGGARALRILKKQLASGLSVALTPDGPRGPKYQVQPGVVALAQMTGCPILPISLNAPRRWQLKGWDRTQIPKPFSRVDFMIGSPIQVPARLDEEQRRQWAEQVRQALLAITEDGQAE